MKTHVVLRARRSRWGGGGCALRARQILGVGAWEGFCKTGRSRALMAVLLLRWFIDKAEVKDRLAVPFLALYLI